MSGRNACSFDGQCKTGYCKGGVCTAKQAAGAFIAWEESHRCASGTAALWNDKHDGEKQRCCPTKHWTNNWFKGWCTELGDNDECIFDAQCKSGKCRPSEAANGQASDLTSILPCRRALGAGPLCTRLHGSLPIHPGWPEEESKSVDIKENT